MKLNQKRGAHQSFRSSADIHVLVDEDWYFMKYPDVAGTGIPAKDHFLSHGWTEGRQPNYLFHTNWYLGQNTDVEQAGLNPLEHYILSGWKEGRSPHPLFDADFYAKQNPDVRDSNENPLLHYLKSGWAERRIVHPLFDADWYRAQAKLEKGTDALRHYLSDPARTQHISTHPLFDADWYCRRYPAALRSDPLALCDYVMMGWKLGRSPNPQFEANLYLSNYPDVLEAGMDPLIHYMLRAGTEARNPNRVFDTRWYIERYPDVLRSGLNPLLHFLRFGEAEGRNPSPIFDTAFYRSGMNSSEISQLSPLSHYLEIGRQEGRVTLAPDICSIDGFQPHMPWQPTIVLVGHSAPKSGQFFGAERSFLDMAKAIEPLPYNLHIILPNRQPSYEALLRPHCCGIHVTGYGWRNMSRPRNEDTVTRFKKIFKQLRPDLAYANTIMLHEPLHAARALGIKTAVHCRELIDFDDELCTIIGNSSERIIDAVLQDADTVIANSAATARLFSRPGLPQIIVPNIVADELLKLSQRQTGQSLKVGIISSNSEKKGIADFLKVADLCSASKNIEFLIFGPPTDFLRGQLAHRSGIPSPDNLTFPGYASSPAEALGDLDVVLNLSSFNESFGRTVAEAMAAGRIVIAYDAGAISELIDHGRTGFLVSRGNMQAVSDLLAEIAADPEKYAPIRENARSFIRARHSTSTMTENFRRGLPRLIGQQTNTGSVPRPVSRQVVDVTVVVPNYNYERHLPERLSSITAQTVRPKEIVFLDDCSTDNSLTVARQHLEASGIPYTIVENSKNAGVYAQWRHGAKRASSEWLWIAEADDTCAPTFLERMLDRADAETNIIYCQSEKIDEHGTLLSINNLAHTDDVSKDRWLSDYTASGVKEVTSALAFRNVIPNVSATLVRTSEMRSSLERIEGMRFCGDWLLYADILRKGKVAFIAEPLNSFRRHPASVTRKNLRTTAYLQELARVHEFVCQNFPILEPDRQRMLHFLDKDFKIEGVARNSTDRSIASRLQTAAKAVAARRHIAFITTNNGSFFGGSEMLWREAAEMLRAAGDVVSVLIKRWEPKPDFIAHMELIGINVLHKEEAGLESLIAGSPDLVVLSLGDQDEGTEFFKPLADHEIPYVIVNQLTKEPRFWPVRHNRTEAVASGYLEAERVFFTCRNNWKVMEERLQRPIRNAAIHFNPYHINRDQVPAWPSEKGGVQIAIPSKLLFIHKGQDLIAEAVKTDTWRSRNVWFNFYGIGPDEENLRSLAVKYGIRNFRFHGRVDDISEIWKSNHALLMPSRMEGLPIMLVSAALSARALIVTDIGGHSELAEDGVTGFLAPDPSAEDISAALERAWQALPDWRQIGQNARARVLAFLPEDPVRHFLSHLSVVMNT